MQSQSANTNFTRDLRAFASQMVQTGNLRDFSPIANPNYSSLAISNPADLRNLVKGHRLGNYFRDCQVASESLLRRFACYGVMHGSTVASSDYVNGFNQIEQSLNEVQRDLVARGNENFRNTTCAFGNLRFSTNQTGNLYPSAEFYCEGPLGGQSQPLPVVSATRTQDVARVIQDQFRLAYAISPTCNSSATGAEFRTSCNMTIQTPDYSPITSSAERAELVRVATEGVRSRVFSRSPSYYRSLSCTIQSQIERIRTNSSLPPANRMRYQEIGLSCAVNTNY